MRGFFQPCSAQMCSADFLAVSMSGPSTASEVDLTMPFLAT